MSNGYVGLGGNVTPVYPLDLNGTINVTTGYNVDGVTLADANRNLTAGTVSCGAITSSSGIIGSYFNTSGSYNTNGGGVYQLNGSTAIDANRNIYGTEFYGSGAGLTDIPTSQLVGTFSGTGGIVLSYI